MLWNVYTNAAILIHTGTHYVTCYFFVNSVHNVHFSWSKLAAENTQSGHHDRRPMNANLSLVE